MLPFARAAARRARFRFGLEEDDTFQDIMLECWSELVRDDFRPENPAGALQKRIRFAVGHAVQKRYWRRGNGVTDQWPEGLEVPAPQRDQDAAIDVARELLKHPPVARKAFMLRYAAGVDAKDVAQRLALTPSGVAHHTDRILSAFGVKEKRRPRRDVTVYHFKNDDGREVRGNRAALAAEIGHAGAVSEIIGGKKQHYKGWRLA